MRVLVKEEILLKFIVAGVFPTKYTIKQILGYSVQSLMRGGIKVSDLQKDFKYHKLNLCHNLLCSNKAKIKFCSKACSATVSNKLRVRNKQIKTCSHCAKTLKYSAKKFCNVTCQYNYNYNKFISNWLITRQSISITAAIRKYIFIKYKSCCSLCGWAEVNLKSGTIPLEIDHIDGNSSNNAEDNLRLLCPNCHSLTPTYKALNKGNGRKNRNKALVI